MKSLLQRIAAGEILVSDGAMGTLLQAKGLQAGECPEAWCVSHQEVVRGIAEAYIAAGADIVETNSFGGSALKLEPHGMAGRVRELNRAAAALAKEAMGSSGYVAGSVGPTGCIAEEEGGDTPAARFYEVFREQAAALAEGGADLICVETMSSLIEAAQAIKAARDAAALPVICTFTFASGPRGFHTMMGVPPERAGREAVAAGADIVGANCGNGITDMATIVRQMRAALPRVPILVQANAGVPVLRDGQTIFRETPEFMAAGAREVIAAGVSVIGGCCGTTPEHIAAMAKVVRELKRA